MTLIPIRGCECARSAQGERSPECGDYEGAFPVSYFIPGRYVRCSEFSRVINRTPPRDWAKGLPLPVEGDQRDFVGYRTPVPEDVAGRAEVLEGDGAGGVKQHTPLRCRIRFHTVEGARSPHRTPTSSRRSARPRRSGTQRQRFSSLPRGPRRERAFRRLAISTASSWLCARHYIPLCPTIHVISEVPTGCPEVKIVDAMIRLRISAASGRRVILVGGMSTVPRRISRGKVRGGN